jgi:hypothetical protein
MPVIPVNKVVDKKIIIGTVTNVILTLSCQIFEGWIIESV